MMEAWVRFAATGDPNGGILPSWPRYVPGTDPYLEIGDSIVARDGYRNKQLDFLEEFFDGRLAK
jgi:carboxylesterase type B